MRYKTLYVMIALLLSLAPLLFSMSPQAAHADDDAATHLANGIAALTETFDTPLAYAELNAAVAADPNLWAAYRWRAQLYYEVGALDLALADLNTVLENEPENVEALIWRARVYAGPFPVDLPLNPFFLTQAGLVGYGRQPDLAQADIESALELDSENPAVWVAYGDVLGADVFAQLNVSPGAASTPSDELTARLDEVVAAYQRALELDPANGMAVYHRTFFEVLLTSSVEINAPTSDQEAITAALEQVGTQLPNHPAGAFAQVLAQFATMFGSDIEIADLMTEMLARFPNHAPLHYWIASFALNVQRFQSDALRQDFILSKFARAFELAPYSPLYQFGETQSLAGRQAIPLLEAILEETPGYPPALYYLTILHAQAGTLESCDMAALLVGEVQAAPVDEYALSLWMQQIEAVYQFSCIPATPTAIPVEVVLLPATSSRFAIGDSVTLPGPVFFKLKESPADLVDNIICGGGTSATVLEIAQVEGDLTTIYLQLECDGGIGWTDETLLPN
jgi:tetratricopeptide (TPR) repeat protein